MTYKKKITVLLSIIAALTLVYIASIVFDPQRISSRSSAYSWLDASQNEKISGITIANSEETITLVRNGGRWFVSYNGKDYPARQTRVEDFIAVLNKRAPYPVRSSSASSHERLWLTENTGTRVTVMAGAGIPLLSLLVGQEDITGQNIYLRKQGQNEVRSGQDIFSAYTASTRTAWYNLRLFPERESGRFDIDDVQRLTVYPPADEDGTTDGPMIFTRSGKEWTFNFAVANPDMEKVNSYIRDILNTTGDDFTDAVTVTDPSFNNSRLMLELGNGAIRTIRIGPPNEEGQHFAAISGSDLVYVLSGWASRRLFADAGSFGE